MSKSQFSENLCEVRFRKMWILDDCLVIGIVLLFIFLNYISNKRFYDLGDSLPGPKALPLIGTAYILLGKDATKKYDGLMKTLENYSSPCRFWACNELWIMIYEPEQIKIVLTSPETVDKSIFYKFSECWFGTGLIHAPGPIWRPHRKLIQPAFNPKILRSYIDIFEKHAKILVQNMAVELNRDEFAILPYFSVSSLNSVLESTMGFTENSTTANHSKFVATVRRALELLNSRMVSVLLRSDIIYKFTQSSKDLDNCLKYIRNTATNVIQKKKMEMEDFKSEGDIEENKNKSFMELILELQEEQKLSDRDINDEVNTMLIAGYETVSNTLQFTVLMLASHPDIQEKVYKELIDIFDDNNSETVSMTYEDLQRMEYMERVIKESLRLFPPGLLISRFVQDDLNIGDYTLPKGSTIILNIAKIHRDEKYWTDPLKFDPDRFLPEEITKRHPYSYIPFSGGPRNCIGLVYAMLELKVTLATILRQYVFKKKEIQSVGNIKLKLGALISPTVPISVKIEKRIFESALV